MGLFHKKEACPVCGGEVKGLFHKKIGGKKALCKDCSAQVSMAKELLKDFPSDIPAYIRLNIKHQDFLPPTALDEAVKLTEGKRCRFCLINLEKVEREEADGETLTIQQFQEESPLEIARMFAEQEGKSFDEDLIELFNQAVNTLDEE